MLLAESLLGSSSTAANYIEDVFSTYLYTGNSTSGGTQTITNGVDLSTKGGMVWIKGRSAASDNVLFDTARGAGTTASNNQALSSNLTTAEDLGASYDFLSAFNADGFTVKQGGTTTTTRGTNYNAVTYASWTFRKQAKFFDVVTYTGNGVSGRTISHNLGSVPGCIIVKCTSTTGEYWAVYHTSTGPTKYLWLQSTIPASVASTYWNDTAPTSSVFSVGNDGAVNGNGKTYVAYLFAHDAGGFGASGSDNVISCGSFTGTSKVTLGYEPQFVLMKQSNAASSWYLYDTMRGIFADASNNNDPYLTANNDFAEATGQNYIGIDATGFTPSSAAVGPSDTWIYIAIRRGPMKTPTSGTSVYNAIVRTGTNATATITGVGFAADLFVADRRSTGDNGWWDRLRGTTKALWSNSTSAELTTTVGAGLTSFNMDGVTLGTDWNGENASGSSIINWFFRRAPGFFDVVCYTGTGANRTVSHNLGVAPELMIVKQRAGSGYGQWFVYNSASGNTKVLELQDATSGAYADSSAWNNTSPTSSVFTVGTSGATNYSGSTFVAYLFATVAGVSKVGSYTGSGTTKQIDCGFTNGARFVLIRRTDSGGGWYVWDSARGIVAGNDPYLLLNSTAAEVTNTDYIDTYSAGFEISSTAPAAINASGGTFIFLAIA